MSRNLTAEAALASQAAVIRPVLLARLDFASGVVAANSGVNTLSYNGDDYLGVGSYGTVSAIGEGLEAKPYGVDMTLSGIPTEMLSLALGEHYQGRDARVYLALLDEQHRLINDPFLVGRFRMDTMNVELGQSATITLSAENRLADWSRPRVRRYNHEDQQARYPGDLGLEYVTGMVEKPIIWGRQ